MKALVKWLSTRYSVYLHDHCRDKLSLTGQTLMEVLEKTVDRENFRWKIESAVLEWMQMTENRADRRILAVAMMRVTQQRHKALIIRNMAQDWKDPEYTIGIDMASQAGVSGGMAVNLSHKVKAQQDTAFTADDRTFDNVLSALQKGFKP